MNILDKINIKTIVKDHLRTLVNNQTGEPDISDWFTFFILPLGLSFIWVLLDIVLTTDYVDIIVSALSIFVGLLFNVIVILFDTIRGQKVRLIKLWVVRESISNISFCIFISILSIACALSSQLPWGKQFQVILDFVTYFLLFEFAITLLMVLKRMYILFIGELIEIENTIPNEEKKGIYIDRLDRQNGKTSLFLAIITFIVLLCIVIYIKK